MLKPWFVCCVGVCGDRVSAHTHALNAKSKHSYDTRLPVSKKTKQEYVRISSEIQREWQSSNAFFTPMQINGACTLHSQSI